MGQLVLWVARNMHCLAMLPETLPRLLDVLFFQQLDGELEIHIPRECCLPGAFCTVGRAVCKKSTVCQGWAWWPMGTGSERQWQAVAGTAQHNSPVNSQVMVELRFCSVRAKQQLNVRLYVPHSQGYCEWKSCFSGSMKPELSSVSHPALTF